MTCRPKKKTSDDRKKNKNRVELDNRTLASYKDEGDDDTIMIAETFN